MIPTAIPVSPSVRIQMALVMAGADFRCTATALYGSVDYHGNAMVARQACPSCGRTLGDYARALDVVSWP